MVRGVPDTFHLAITHDPSVELDVDRARDQHHSYTERLAAAGLTLERVPAAPDYPDCVFVEDTAVILGSIAIMTRSGAPARRGETTAVAARLADRFPLVEIQAPATIDGGDVLIMGNIVFVGLSGRTNQGAIDQMSGIVRDQGMELVPVPVHGALHLKSAVLPVGNRTVVVTPDTVDEGRLTDLDIVYEHPEERMRFSALPLAAERVLVTASAPRTTEMLASRGFEPDPIDISEFQAADGGLTCMSIIFDDAP